MTASTLEALATEIQSLGPHPAEWVEKMLHTVPEADVVGRLAFVLERCTGRTVLNIGSDSGGLHERIAKVAKEAIGLDRVKGPRTDYVFDLDTPEVNDEGYGLRPVVIHPTPDLVVMGEVLEHLSNPGITLDWLKGLDVEVLITVPNAFSRGAQRDGYEVVNRDHVCWYSWKTATTLLKRHGFEVKEWYWYNGQPLTAEGLIFVVR